MISKVQTQLTTIPEKKKNSQQNLQKNPLEYSKRSCIKNRDADHTFVWSELLLGALQ
jgi:ribosomal protein S30